MIMNYVLSFCKITAASRIFSRNFYLPLLKPLTPKDALRTFKITGKWLLGSKIQHYIPVLYNHKKKRSKRVKNFGKVTHRYDDSYTYMAPIFDEENENHMRLKKIIESKAANGMNDCLFIYTVDDKMCNIVFSGKFELAIQDGDIIDILISQSDDKVLIKMKDFRKIPLQLQCYDKDDLINQMMKGEGATTEEEEKFHHHGKQTMKLAKIFEAKELAEEWEQEMMKIVAKKKKQKGEGTKEWQEMVSQTIENIDWQKFEVEAKKVIDQIMEPASEEHIGMVVEDLEKTKNVTEFFNQAGNDSLNCLPTLTEIPDVVKNMATAVYDELEDETGNHRISGVRVTLSNGKECFIIGQMVKTDEGDVFIPGQTIENEFGVSYAPGMTIFMDGKPHLIKGLIMGEDCENGEEDKKPMFLPTESSITTDGALTFCRNPEELCKAQPHKIFVKRKKDKSKKKMKKKVTNDMKVQNEMELEQDKCLTNGIDEVEMESFQIRDLIQDLDVITEEHDEDGLLDEVIPVIEPIITVEPITNEKTQSEEDLDEFLKLERLLELQELEDGQKQDLEIISEEKQKTFEEIQNPEEMENRQKSEEFSFKNPDDGMEKLIDSLEDKKSELQEKLEALRRLSVTLENSVTYVQTQDTETVATQITSDPDQQHKIGEILLTLTRRMSQFRERTTINFKNIQNLASYTSESKSQSYLNDSDDKFEKSSEDLKRIVMSAIYGANEVYKKRPKDQQLALKTLASILRTELQENPKLIEELCSLCIERNDVYTSALCMLTQKIRECKVDLLKRLVDDFDSERCVEILDNDGVLPTAFKKLTKNSPEACETLQLELQTKIDAVKTESNAKETLQLAIRDACTVYSQELLMNFNIHDEIEYEEVTQEAIGLANTLGLWEVPEVLANRSEVLKLLKRNACKGNNNLIKAKEFLQRFLLIRELCHKDYSVKSSLERIRKHPECGRKDPRIRQLLIESACLMSKQRDLRSSLEVPLQLFKDQNFLAIEDCVYLRTRVDAPILISRKGIQAIVPKEAEANVLAGRVPYTLIDETGVTNFKPMHMFKMTNGKKHNASYLNNNDVRRNSLSDARMAA